MIDRFRSSRGPAMLVMSVWPGLMVGCSPDGGAISVEDGSGGLSSNEGGRPNHPSPLGGSTGGGQVDTISSGGRDGGANGGASSSGGQTASGGTSQPSAHSGGETADGGGDDTGGRASGGASFVHRGDCEALVSDPTIGWRESSLKSDQEIVECLAHTLGRPVGYGEKTRGGYDPSGSSKLVVIEKGLSTSVEEQIIAAISSSDHQWIVFDKEDFAEETEIALYRRQCDDSAVQAALESGEAECLDRAAWCSSRGYDTSECLEQFFNVALNDKDLPIRNPTISSNTTIDGRLSKAYFRFSGFAIGSDSSGQPVETASNVILTHLEFRGAGHAEDHGLDPDMIRSTGASHDIWIHKNTFDKTGDSAFDVKVGAYDITMSFNRVVDVLRASLHGSSDSREINAQITTTMHHNAFVTRDERYLTMGNTGRRVPLIRRGTCHMWNNLFMNYRKDILSVRVFASLLFEDNPVLINAIHQEKDDLQSALQERAEQLMRDVDEGNYRSDGMFLWFSDDDCQIDPITQTPLLEASGTVGQLMSDYSEASREAISQHRLVAGQELVDYISATAGKDGARPFNSPLALGIDEVIAETNRSCQ